ncbi:transcription factor Pcc1-domain-containing protein [Flammula alnicola]|nr:transcription factor Pcc1-domain-containing protein [Flammula alnicola]
MEAAAAMPTVSSLRPSPSPPTRTMEAAAVTPTASSLELSRASHHHNTNRSSLLCRHHIIITTIFRCALFKPEESRAAIELSLYYSEFVGEVPSVYYTIRSSLDGASFFTIEIPFASSKHAAIVKQVIEVDAELQPRAVKRELSIQDNTLTATFQTLTVRLARLTLNAFLENVDLVVRTIEQFGEEAEKGAS